MCEDNEWDEKKKNVCINKTIYLTISTDKLTMVPRNNKKHDIVQFGLTVQLSPSSCRSIAHDRHDLFHLKLYEVPGT